MDIDKNTGFKIVLIYFVKLFLFWMLLFFIQRCLFLAFNYKDLVNIPASQIMLAFWKAIHMDIASACYLMLLPLIIICIGIITPYSLNFFKAAKWVNYVLIVIYMFISFTGLGLYANWGTKINSKAISFLIYPKEVAGIVFNLYNIIYFAVILAIIAPVILFFKYLFKDGFAFKAGIIRTTMFFVIFSGLMLVGARGGFQKYPINKSSCFYSRYPVLNFAALNDFWNFSAVLTNPMIKANPYVYFNKTDAEKTVKELFEIKNDSTEYLLKKNRPNVVLIVLESFSADAIACLGGEKGITPLFDSLAKDGLLFTNAYATGFRTDQGIVAILSSFPAQPRTSIIKNFEKFDKLPNLIKTLNESNYNTSFYYGGDLSYANTETYLQMAGTRTIKDRDDIPHKRNTDWGAYDEDVFNYHLGELNAMSQPFFSTVLSLTNHEYFVADVEKVFLIKPKTTFFIIQLITQQNAFMSTCKKPNMNHGMQIHCLLSQPTMRTNIRSNASTTSPRAITYHCFCMVMF